MVLTTSPRALRAIGANLIETFEGTDLAVLVQGAQPKWVLLERFRLAASEGKGRLPSGGVCVLRGMSGYAR